MHKLVGQSIAVSMKSHPFLPCVSVRPVLPRWLSTQTLWTQFLTWVLIFVSFLLVKQIAPFQLYLCFFISDVMWFLCTFWLHNSSNLNKWGQSAESIMPVMNKRDLLKPSALEQLNEADRVNTFRWICQIKVGFWNFPFLYGHHTKDMYSIYLVANNCNCFRVSFLLFFC